jgi:DNA-dependent protein kinase catalytic subunit
MAENALQSLEYWLKNINLDLLKPYYPLVLKKFDDYLQLNKMPGDDQTIIQEKVISLKTNNSKRGGTKKLSLKLFEKNKNFENADLYEQIQFRILKILGQLAGEMSHCLFEATNNLNNNNQITTWDTVLHLKFDVPFVDIKPTIYFDKFLPRIIYLALSSTNRQTKIVSCELLHAIVIFMIGKSVSNPLDSTSVAYQMNKLYNRIYPSLFK